ncbi:MAG: TIGR00266 family protein [Planctomycetes bacterium]|nr:TIGR00266 family protein [Planctomycetota bacterium]
MQYEIAGNPEYGQLSVQLGPGETFVGEGGSMSWMSEGMEMNSRLLGGFFKAVIRRLVAGESLFVGEYSHPHGGSVTFSPSQPGTIVQRTLKGDSFILTKGSFLGCSPGVELKTRFHGIKAIFSGEGAFFIECSGEGDVFFNSFGAIVEKEVRGSLIVDTSHVVAWEPTLTYALKGMGSIKSTLFSGEGLVLHFTGTGRIYLQTRTMTSLAGWLTSFVT